MWDAECYESALSYIQSHLRAKFFETQLSLGADSRVAHPVSAAAPLEKNEAERARFIRTRIKSERRSRPSPTNRGKFPIENLVSSRASSLPSLVSEFFPSRERVNEFSRIARAWINGRSFPFSPGRARLRNDEIAKVIRVFDIPKTTARKRRTNYYIVSRELLRLIDKTRLSEAPNAQI